MVDVSAVANFNYCFRILVISTDMTHLKGRIFVFLRLHAQSGYIRRFFLKRLSKKQMWKIMTNLQK